MKAIDQKCQKDKKKEEETSEGEESDDDTNVDFQDLQYLIYKFHQKKKYEKDKANDQI